jgi:hypothetical protein
MQQARVMTNGNWFFQWQSLDRWLAQHSAFWRPLPFTESSPRWTEEFELLSRFVGSLSSEACAAYEADINAFVETLCSILPSLAERSALVALPDLSGMDCSLAETRAPAMPGRKREQAGGFAGALLPPTGPVLDWCCGKGHLARTLASRTDHPITGFESNRRLVAEGNRLVRRYGEAVTLHQQDVMAEVLPWPEASHVVALHACGDLHRHLLSQGAHRQLARLSLSPCCYQKSVIDPDRPLSRRIRSQADACHMTRNERQLAVEEMVTAPRRERRQTDCMRAWRLGFDGLQRHLLGTNAYLPVPSHPARLQRGSFDDFCRWAAQQKDLSLPPDTNFDYWERAGDQRLDQVRRHELVRHIFRRPLELWLVLDLVLFLEEQGYEVRLGTFCERALTPRNLLIDAHWIA